MTIRTLLANALAILIAAVAAEGIVRVAIHPALDYTSGFSPGPYCSRRPLGISFNCPDYVGMMHEIGTNLYLPHRMNAEGFRGPYVSPLPDRSVSNIVVLGGQSQAFGYGLLDKDTIGAQIAKGCVSADVHVFSLPSVSDAQSWKLYNLSAEAGSPPDQIVLMIYTRAHKAWRGEIKPESKLRRAIHAFVRLAVHDAKMAGKILGQLSHRPVGEEHSRDRRLFWLRRKFPA